MYWYVPRFRKWGVVEEYHEAGKAMMDYDTGKDIPSPPIQSLAHTLGLTVKWQRWDRTAHGWHLIVKFRQKLTLPETVAFQAIAGSDRSRERLNLARAISLRLHPSRYWQERANILFSRKVKA